MNQQLNRTTIARSENLICYQARAISKITLINRATKRIVCRPCYEKFVKDPCSFFVHIRDMHIIAESQTRIRVDCNICDRRLLEMQQARTCRTCVMSYALYGEKLLEYGGAAHLAIDNLCDGDCNVKGSPCADANNYSNLFGNV